MNTVLIDGIEYSLKGLEKDVWLRILNGSLKYKDVLHNPVVANVNQYGVNIRTVVLRKVNIAEKQLAFHTDIRSGKWNDLQQQNNISWLFYDAPGRIQIRLSGTATLHQDDAVAEEAWTTSTMSSRKIYLGETGPSAIAASPVSGLPAAFEANDPSPEESRAGRKNFGVVITTVTRMEWLWLNSKGHRRAGFTYSEDGSFKGDWLIP
jgi:pyridoxamine 5'-phosphate oxidase